MGLLTNALRAQVKGTKNESNYEIVKLINTILKTTFNNKTLIISQKNLS